MKIPEIKMFLIFLRQNPAPSRHHRLIFHSLNSYLKPKKTLFTHMTALLDQEDLLSKCPENVEPAYDGLEITL